jgi:hypothetical protein
MVSTEKSQLTSRSIEAFTRVWQIESIDSSHPKPDCIVDDITDETSTEDILKALEPLALPEPDAMITLMGGAEQMAPEDQTKIKQILREVFLKIGDEIDNIYFGDGGTFSGIMAIVTEVVTQIRAVHKEKAALAFAGEGEPVARSVTAIGVPPKQKVAVHGESVLDGKYALAPNHVIIPVDVTDQEILINGGWGGETPTMYRLFAALTKDIPSIGIMVNGGSITMKELAENIKQKRPIIVLNGSGRKADAVSNWVSGEATENPFGDLLANQNLTDAEVKELLIVVDMNRDDAVTVIVDEIMKKFNVQLDS